jgi:hypothetical protein
MKSDKSEIDNKIREYAKLQVDIGEWAGILLSEEVET